MFERKPLLKCCIKVLGMSESIWNGMASLKQKSDETVVYVGDDEVHQVGVAITISKGIIKARF